MTLHPEELAELRQKSLRGPRSSRERLERGIDTGWVVDEDNFFTRANTSGEYWIADNRIWGPRNAGEYSVDKEGRVLFGSMETGFYITEDEREVTRVYGPSPDLPWMK